MTTPNLTFDAARDAVRALVASLDADNAPRLAQLEKIKQDTAGDTIAFMAAATPVAMAMTSETLAKLGFDTASPAGLMAFVAQVVAHETAQAAASSGGANAAFSADVARVRALLMPPTMSVPDNMAAKRAAMDARMKARRAKADAKAAARKAKQLM